MEVETKIISTEIIKPSSPTPKSLQKHQLSFLDQGVPPLYAPQVYFYTSNPEIPNSQKSNHLKKSLSKTLSRFYPFAGCLVDNLYVDCNDRSVPFTEAAADHDLSRVITNPDTNKMKKLLFYNFDESQGYCLAVQATYFRCGGLALGLLIHHKVADASSSFTLANTWSAVARDSGRSVPSPKFDAAAYFPPRDGSRVFRKEEVATRIFTFPAARIAALQERYSSAIAGGSGGTPRRRPSRVEALSAHIWTQFLRATGRQGDPTKIYTAHSLVNIRSLVYPPLSEYHFGNIFLATTAELAARDGGAEFIQKVREAKKAVHDRCVVGVKVMDETREMKSEADAGKRRVSFAFSSLCGFQLYEANFGWGKPVWVVSLGFPAKNATIFTDAKCGGGIEALISLSKADMEKFEAHFDIPLKSNL